MTLTLAIQNLCCDRVRLAVTLVGVVFAVVLIAVQIGIFVGFGRTTSALIDHSGAAVWLAGKGTKNVDQAPPISERRLYQALAVPGVVDAKRFLTDFVLWQKPAGGIESILIVGFDPESGVGGPWNVVAGDVRQLKTPDTVMIDELYREQLGVSEIGQVVEINGRRARVVGFTRGIRSFSLSPYVFASFKTAQAYARMREDETKFILLKVAPGFSPDVIKRELAVRLPEVEVYTQDEFSRSTQIHWLFRTGAGLALLAAAVLGLAVGMVVVAQTLYATTVDHIKEFATLRAIGASNRYIHAVIIYQALVAAGVGYAIGILISFGIVRSAANAGPAILLPWQLALGLAVLTVMMCTTAGLISISRVTRLDPAMVFK
jgi:putative ABC transport system permease protein